MPSKALGSGLGGPQRDTAAKSQSRAILSEAKNLSTGCKLNFHAIARPFSRGRGIKVTDWNLAAVLSCAFLAVLLIAGCQSVRDIRVDSGQAPAVPPVEAQQMGAAGRALFAAQPRTLARATEAAHLLAAAAHTLRNNYDAQWTAAEAWAFVADNEPGKAERIAAAKCGITLARAARELQPGRSEGHYWYAITVGLLADADRAYGLKAVGEMEPALRRAIELDERYDYGGPVRVLGLLVLRTPAPPVSIGSARKALRLLQRAAELFPDYPENMLYLAEAFRDNHRNAEARELLTKVINAQPWPDRQFESAGWKTAAQVLLQCVPVN